MSKPTPGPWRVCPTNGGIMIAGETPGKPGYFAQVLSQYPENARLMAAAPELLAALERLLQRYQVITQDGYEDPGGDITAARAAISKARGT